MNKGMNVPNALLASQIIEQIKKSMEKINELVYGEITIYVRDGKLVRWVISESFLPDQNQEGAS